MCSVRLVLVQTFALGAAKRETQRLLHLFSSIEAAVRRMKEMRMTASSAGVGKFSHMYAM